MENRKLLQLIKCILNRQTSCDCAVTAEEWPKLIRLAQRHSVVGILGSVLPLLSPQQMPSDEALQKLRKLMMTITMIDSNQMYAAGQIREAFEERGIWHVLLKGCTTRELYPQPEMRSMNDLDILCKPNQQKQIRHVMQQLGFDGYQEGRKHDIYNRKPFVCVEMHREMVAARSPFSRYYRDVWNRCKPVEGRSFSCEMTVTDAFVYNMVHLAGHLEEGGIGIRFITDIYVYDHSDKLDKEALKTELDKLGLWQLYCNVSCLANCWFAPEKPSLSPQQEQLMQRLSDFVLGGGLFGKPGDGGALAVQKTGRVGHFFAACFPSYAEMRSVYPWLERWPILLPWSWILRGIRSVLFHRRNIASQLRISTNGDSRRGAELRSLYRDIGYDK